MYFIHYILYFIKVEKVAQLIGNNARQTITDNNNNQKGKRERVAKVKKGDLPAQSRSGIFQRGEDLLIRLAKC